MAFQPFATAEIESALGGRYIVGPEIAVGGQGAVFRAIRTSRLDGTAANDIVALKLHLHAGQAVHVQREASAMENFSHPNLARLIEHGYCDVAGRHTRYIAYEFIEGESLKLHLKSGRLLESEVLPIGRDMADAIAALWSRHIVHGDIKPSNIMLRNAGAAVLIDLGIASFIEEDAAPKPFRPVSHFAPEQVRPWGTSGYMSPEQARGVRPLSYASDIFSLGVVMLESIQGWHPTNEEQSALADGIRASDRRLTVSAGLISMLDMMLSADPRSRGNIANLSGHFQMLQRRIEEGFAQGARTPQKAEEE
jgi:eukaryotic-like serine/threonine-protein kinase